MQFPDHEIERDIKRLIGSFVLKAKRDAALAWLKARVDAFKALERLG